jgi:hypothetical protein
MAAMVGRVTFLRVVVEAPSGEWEECRMVECVGWRTACWTLARFRDLFAAVQAREGVAAARVVGIVALSKARDMMFALILGVLVEYVRSDVVDSKRGQVNLARRSMTAT